MIINYMSINSGSISHSIPSLQSGLKNAAVVDAAADGLVRPLSSLLPIIEASTGLVVSPYSILGLPPLSAWSIRGKPLLFTVAHDVSDAIPEFWSQACGPSDVLDVLCAAVTGSEVCLARRVNVLHQLRPVLVEAGVVEGPPSGPGKQSYHLI